MQNANSINIESLDPMDYDSLKEFGLQYIRSIGHQYWTDFNIHDPGVTIFEALCLSLTDLAYRTRFDMKDLLTKYDKALPEIDSPLYTPDQILSHNPLTELDYRKFFIEHVPGVKNVTLETVTKSYTTPVINTYNGAESIDVQGFYRLNVELEDDSYLKQERIRQILGRGMDGTYTEKYDTAAERREACIQYVKNFYLMHRNLCEDIKEIQLVDNVEIGICGEICISKTADYEFVVNEIYDKVSEYVSPSIKYYTIDELMAKGRTPEEIYQGELPRYRFLDVVELEDYNHRESVYISDILTIIMKIDGVESVEHLHFVYDSKSAKALTCSKYCIRFTNEVLFSKYSMRLASLANFHTKLTHNKLYSQLVLVRNGFPFVPKIRKKKTAIVDARGIDEDRKLKINIEKGKCRHTDEYVSFQDYLPKAYHVGFDGIQDSESEEKKTARLQLKAYLTFFDQLLADYLEQLSSIREFYSVKGSKEVDKTYFYHELSENEIKDVSKVLSERGKDTKEEDYRNLERKSRVLDHLLARFNESFTDYAMLRFFSDKNYNFKSSFSLKEEIEDKKRMLRSYPFLSGHRMQALDYTLKRYSDKDEFSNYAIEASGIERRILAKLGIDQPNKTLAGGQVYKAFDRAFGLHVIEHMLLLPIGELTRDNFLKLISDDDSMEIIDDPYSFRCTVVVPGWLDISKNLYFRQYVERIITEEFPPHISLKICWLSEDVMERFEKAYVNFLAYKAATPSSYFVNESVAQNTNNTELETWKNNINKSIVQLANVFHCFRNLYPVSKLPLATDDLNNSEIRLDYITLEDNKK